MGFDVFSGILIKHLTTFKHGLRDFGKDFQLGLG